MNGIGETESDFWGNWFLIRSIIDHRIDHNRVSVPRGQWH